MALDAVLRSQLLYGLESAELGMTLLNKLDTFQLKGLRKILKLDTTYVNRANTNRAVMDMFDKLNITDKYDGININLTWCCSFILHKNPIIL